MNPAALALTFLLSAAPAFAGEACDVPVSDWQPRETLRARLEASGLTVRTITAQDGCYEAVVIVDATGNVVAITFNPKTLAKVGAEHAPARI